MKRILFFSLFLLSLGLAAQEKTDFAADSLLRVHLDSLVMATLPRGGNVGIYAYDLTDKRVLYDYQADKLGRPASNMKLLTTITALDQPQADEPFRTEVWTRGEVRGDTLWGSLYVVGGMDPEFDDAAMDSLVAQVLRQPFSTLCGPIYGDISLRDSLTYGNGWAWDDIPYSYQPCLSPLMFCKGVLTVKAQPAREAGDTARLTLVPASTYYTVENRTQSRTPRAGRFSVNRNWLEQGNRITVSGQVDGVCRGEVTIHSSERFFMHTFVERLRAGGLHIVDEAQACGQALPCWGWAERLPEEGDRCVAFHETSMQKVVEQVMKESDNLNTEAILTRLGAQTTGHRHIHVDDGLKAVQELIKKVGLNPDDYHLADGCGLSNYNAVSPLLLATFLQYAYSRTDIFRKLYKALPVAGVDGTLKGRMRKGSPAYGNVHAKTGTISGVSSLSGYLQGRSGHWIVFSIMNQNQLSGRDARRMQDALCEEFIQCY